MVEDGLYFIQPHVLERVISGQFVAKRQQAASFRMRDRRDLLSPLNIVRRAIRYEPRVFANRREEIIKAAEALNHPDIKLILVSGRSGRGKTSFIRGLAEMMGGGKEQLLWFDVSRHTDYDEVIRFLVEYMTYICRSAEETQDVPETQNPVATLELLLRQASDHPILITIDNVEHLVAAGQTIRSRELKEAFNFLLSFPNVKLILSGRQLPYADMNPSASAVYHVDLPPLSQDTSNTLVKDLFRNSESGAKDLTGLTAHFHGEPYLLFLFSTLFERHPDTLAWQQALSENAQKPEWVLVDYLYQHLSDSEQRILMILSLIRHGVTPSGMAAIVTYCDPELERFDFKHLDHSFLRLVLKKVYPPQMVLNKLRHRHQQSSEHQGIEAYYQVSEVMQELILQRSSEVQQSDLHERLQAFYLAERKKHVLERTYQARTRHLAAEAQYHYNRIRRRRNLTASREPSPVDIAALKPEFEPSADPTSISRFPFTAPPSPLIHPGTKTGFMSERVSMWPAVSPPDPFGSPEPVYPTAFEPREASLEMPPVTVPISIQVESGATTAPMVRLTEDDLQKLAELIAKTDYRPLHEAEGSPSNTSTTPETESGTSIASTDRDPPKILAELGLEETDAQEHDILKGLEDAIIRHHRGAIAQRLLHLAKHRIERGLYQNAELCLLKAQEYAEAEGAVLEQIDIHTALGHLYQGQFQHNKALRHLRSVEHLYEAQGQQAPNKAPLAEAYRDMAEILFFRRELPEALSLYQKSLALRPNDTGFTADVLFKLALAYDDAGEWENAMRCYRESFEVNSRLGNDDVCAASLYNLASLYCDQSQLKEAEETLNRCLIYDRRIGSDREVFRTLMRLSKINEARHALQPAQEFAMGAYQVAQQADSKTDMASACMRLGHLAELVNAWSEAITYYEEAQAIGGEELSRESAQLIQRRLKAIKEHHP